MIEVRQVKAKKEIKEFIEFPLRLYKDNPYFVPPLYGDEKALFKSKTVYDDQCETVYFIALKDGKTVGRISAILQRASNEKWQQKRVRFTRFDCIDNPFFYCHGEILVQQFFKFMDFNIFKEFVSSRVRSSAMSS